MKPMPFMSRALAVTLTAVALGGCATSPPTQYHALSSFAPPQTSGNARLLVEILPVAMPERLNREEMVFSTTAGLLEVRESDHWAAPLSDEIRQILSDTLWGELWAADVYQAPVPASAAGLPQIRLALRIERFEAVPGHAAVVQGSWTARQLPQGRSTTCRASIAVPLPGLNPQDAAIALSDGTGQLTRLVAVSIGRLAQDNACPPG